MTTLTSSQSVPVHRTGFLRVLGYVILAAGAIAVAYRFLFGLGAATHLSDGYPWGLWISFDVLTGVALAGGGFTISAAAYVFALKKFEPLLRPAKLSAFIGYVMVVVGLLFDLGQPWRIWHALVMWNTSSVLFEVAWCVMLYTAVLGVDVLIMALEAWKKESLARSLRRIYVLLVVAGLVLSTLHQSSLGALFLILPEKMSDLWASKAIGPLFYASAVTSGLAVVIVESLLTAKAHRHEPESELLASLSKGLAVALLVYFGMKATDLYARGVSIWQLDLPHVLFWVELFGTVVLPGALLGFRRVRASRSGLLWAAGLVVVGVVLNRFNVSLTGYRPPSGFSYFPSIPEIAVTLSLIAFAVFAFDYGTHHLPLHAHPHGEPQKS